ncbi:MAG: hypothetical protein AAF614_19480 [Chloroflexota bacterium]
MTLNSEIRQATEPLIRFLDENRIQYHIGGSVASSAHGIPRTTIDVDLVADIELHQVAQMVQSLQPIYYIDATMIQNAINSLSSFNLIHLETIIKIDIFILKKDAFAQQVMSRAVEGILSIGEAEPFHVRFSSPEDIVLHKLSWFRLGGEQSERQWQDILGVLNVQGDSLDFAYMRSWAKQINVTDLLDQALSQI